MDFCGGFILGGACAGIIIRRYRAHCGAHREPDDKRHNYKHCPVHAMQITRRLEFDAGHRIPDHQSHCRHLHGHRYVIEITLAVMDFSEVKSLALASLVDSWDHAFIVYCGDTAIVEFLKTIPDHKTVVLDVVPTAENLAAIAFAKLDAVYRDRYGNHLQLERIRLYETPNCWADALRADQPS